MTRLQKDSGTALLADEMVVQQKVIPTRKTAIPEDSLDSLVETVAGYKFIVDDDGDILVYGT